ncbi:unnamed protein product, partial [Discosporangium mesarthrocarpum]
SLVASRGEDGSLVGRLGNGDALEMDGGDNSTRNSSESGRAAIASHPYRGTTAQSTTANGQENPGKPSLRGRGVKRAAPGPQGRPGSLSGPTAYDLGAQGGSRAAVPTPPSPEPRPLRLECPPVISTGGLTAPGDRDSSGSSGNSSFSSSLAEKTDAAQGDPAVVGGVPGERAASGREAFGGQSVVVPPADTVA